MLTIVIIALCFVVLVLVVGKYLSSRYGKEFRQAQKESEECCKKNNKND